MGKKRRKTRGSKPQPVKAISHFTEVEEAFFKAGMQEYEAAAPESFDARDEGYRRPSLLERLFSRWQQPVLAGR